MPAMSRCFDSDCNGRDVKVASVRLPGSPVHYLQIRCARCESVLGLVETVGRSHEERRAASSRAPGLVSVRDSR